MNRSGLRGEIILLDLLLSRYPWGQDAFDKAKADNKPIFLSVGYSTCHWCHVMERESFESEKIAKILNDNFVSVKVDREERPDVDKVYMTFVQVCPFMCIIALYNTSVVCVMLYVNLLSSHCYIPKTFFTSVDLLGSCHCSEQF